MFVSPFPTMTVPSGDKKHGSDESLAGGQSLAGPVTTGGFPDKVMVQEEPGSQAAPGCRVSSKARVVGVTAPTMGTDRGMEPRVRKVFSSNVAAWLVGRL